MIDQGDASPAGETTLYHVTKHYPHSLGLSVAFRQHRADSHCRFIHGYSLAFTFEFCAMELHNNWVIDFGGLKPLKEWLVETFDHKLLIARDDKLLWEEVEFMGTANTDGVDDIGMEAFALMAFRAAQRLLIVGRHSPRVQLAKVTVAEHEGNSASFSEPVQFG